MLPGSSGPTRRAILRAASLLPVAASGPFLRAGDTAKGQNAVDQLLEKIVANEHKVLKTLADRTPIVETYIQENVTNGIPTEQSRDDYFLGRMGLVNAVRYVSFVHRQAEPPAIAETRTTSRFWVLRKKVVSEQVPDHVVFLPEGFAQMAVIDASSFDRRTYNFSYVRREFLGEVRCFVFDIAPVRQNEPGRFVGRIWVEDEGCFVVRANGTYTGTSSDELYFHFDSWRVNAGPGMWVPSVVYIEDAVSLGQPASGPAPGGRFKGQTRIWSYQSPTNNHLEELTAILVDNSRNVRDPNEAAGISPVESQRRWEHEAEMNVLERLEAVGLLAPEAEVDRVLDTVTNNLIVTNNLDVEARCRLLLTTPLETFTIGHTIVVSRGLVDVLPDEASLALVLAAELAHIALGHPTQTEYSFNDRTMVSDEAVLERFRFVRTEDQVASASKKAIALLANSPYRDKLANAGLFLRMLTARTARLTNLIQSTLGTDLSRFLEMPEFQALLAQAPPLEENRLEQIAALPLGSRVGVEPWSNRTTLLKPRPVALLSAREKMPLEIAPPGVYLTRTAMP